MECAVLNVKALNVTSIPFSMFSKNSSVHFTVCIFKSFSLSLVILGCLNQGLEFIRSSRTFGNLPSFLTYSELRQNVVGMALLLLSSATIRKSVLGFSTPCL